MVKTIYILSHGRNADNPPPILGWLQKFKNVCWVISADNDIKYYKTLPGKIWPCPSGISLSQKRERILVGHAKNDWVFMVHDNIIKVTGQDHIKWVSSHPTRQDLSWPWNPKQMVELVNQEIRNVKQGFGGCLIGFASNENHFFRKYNHTSVGFVWGKMVVMKNDGIKWRHDLIGMEDYAFTAEALIHGGAVWINKWIYAKATTPKEEKLSRVRAKIAACKKLVKEYKGLYRFNQRPGKPANSELMMRFHSEKQIQLWRMQFKTKNYQQS